MYGTVLIGLILAGRLKELKVVYILTGNINLEVNICLKIELYLTVFDSSFFIVTLQFIMELKIRFGI